MKLTREIKTAILVIASILLFVWGYSFLKGSDLFTKYKTIYVEYDNVEGLIPSAPVTLNGLVVGKINNITINNTNGRLLVELQINTDFPISKSSNAMIYEPGLIGGKQIAIVPNFADKNILAQGGKLNGIVKLGMADKVAEQLQPLEAKIEKIIENANQMITGVNNVLDQKAQEDLRKSLSELSKTMEQFHKASLSANTILDDNKAQIKGAVGNLNKMTSNFSKISDSLNKADLSKTVKTLNATLTKVNGLVTGLESGKGTMGKLLKDDAMYNNLTKTSKELELLLEDVRLYPTRYINVSLFGKKNKAYKAPTVDSLSINKKK
ncbi:MAG: phospholipid/cholesterol/gamma-HCH transport system substrate-binding protein [Bacteroidota bacterium]|nr:phospholipid/cholesterol/gamma-HCH transport system substrate-binding protein [Bacteroidota bacterium]